MYGEVIKLHGEVIKYHGNSPSLVMYLSVRRIKYLNTLTECQATSPSLLSIMRRDVASVYACIEKVSMISHRAHQKYFVSE